MLLRAKVAIQTVNFLEASELAVVVLVTADDFVALACIGPDLVLGSDCADAWPPSLAPVLDVKSAAKVSVASDPTVAVE